MVVVTLHLFVFVLQVTEQVQAVAVMSNAQSQMSVDTVDCHCQVTPDVTDGAMQTERCGRHADTQTDLSIAWRVERETQAVAAVSESSVQASVPATVVDCQTDSSMANLLSRQVQADVDVMCSDSQTDLSQSDSEAQTEVCFQSLCSCPSRRLHCALHSIHSICLVCNYICLFCAHL